MKTQRRIVKRVRGTPTSDGAGVKLTRFIGTAELRSIDPFLMLDVFESDEPSDYVAGFPDHPHRGFETITYMVAGSFRHRDNKGHEGVLGPGSAQWMTAGRGIIHSEMPEQEEGLVRGFQLWLNLPASEKMREPSYRDLTPRDIPLVKLGTGGEARVLGGIAFDVVGPIGDRATEPVYIDLTLPAGATASIPLPKTHQAFLVPFDGDELFVGSDRLERYELAVLSSEGEEVVLTGGARGSRVLVIAGRPLREPVVQYGPFVMNTIGEIQQAFRDLEAGRF